MFLRRVNFIACSTNQSAMEQEMWPDNPQHGSPVPRPLGRQKRIVESTVTPISTTASHSGSQTHAQHLPWQLDLHSKFIQQQQQQQQQQIQLQEQPQQQQQQEQQQQLTTQLATPSVERLLPIGTARLGMFQYLYLTVVNSVV